MACPTCGHEMHVLQFDAARRNEIRHCSRCGTVVRVYRGCTLAIVPKLVERCRDFGATLNARTQPVYQEFQERWHTLGVAEYIKAPE